MIDALLTIFPLILIGGSLALWIAMLIHALTNRIPDKIVWILVLVFTNTLGAVIYYFMVYYKMPRENQQSVKMWTAITVIGTVALLAVLGVALSAVSVGHATIPHKPAPTASCQDRNESRTLDEILQKTKVAFTASYIDEDTLGNDYVNPPANEHGMRVQVKEVVKGEGVQKGQTVELCHLRGSISAYGEHPEVLVMATGLDGKQWVPVYLSQGVFLRLDNGTYALPKEFNVPSIAIEEIIRK